MKQYIISLLVVMGSIYTSVAQNHSEDYYEGLKINEFYVGEKAEHEYHWIELYNSSDHEIDLNGLFLTSTKSEFTKYKLDESTKVDSGAFVRIYLNKVPENDEQTAFLNINTSEYYFAIVYQTEENKEKIIDYISYEAYGGKKSHKLKLSLGRYPDGIGEWQIMEQITPGLPNNKQNSKVFSTPILLIGAKLGYGMNITNFLDESNAQSIINLKPNIGNSWGIYTRLNLPRVYFMADLMYRKRSYSYDYTLSDSTHKAIFTKKINGKQSVSALEVGIGVGTYITSKINIFTGLNLGITIGANYKYTQLLDANIKKEDELGNIYWEKLTEIYESPEENNYNSADILKVNSIIGVRYELYKNLHFTLTYLSDIIGANFAEEDFQRIVKFRTVLIGVEIPLTIDQQISYSLF